MRKPIIQKLKDLIATSKRDKRIQFDEGSITVDRYTASAILQIYSAISEEAQARMIEASQTREGFVRVGYICSQKARY